MTNAAISAFLSTYGDRVFTINLDNNRTIFLGYREGLTVEDIEVTTNLTDEVLIVHNKMNYNGKEIHYSVYHSSDNVQWVGVMDAASNNYRPNPIEFK